MKVEQLSITLPDKTDSLVRITTLLAGSCINIKALSLADSEPFGHLRVVVNDTAKAIQILAEHRFEVETSEILVLEVPDRPGGVASVLQILNDVGLSVRYLYAFAQKTGKSGLIIFRIDALDSATKTLTEAGVRVLSSEEVFAL
ncbi:MAG: amino acid-binding protein [Deltaproteobacteria bacterium RIFOXYD12_FULL_50_9]|nr:MAG: amino acid-binding protein [Deltaproteobacteria bacterium RIFOXYD12_FULL_50_9]